RIDFLLRRRARRLLRHERVNLRERFGRDVGGKLPLGRLRRCADVRAERGQTEESDQRDGEDTSSLHLAPHAGLRTVVASAAGSMAWTAGSAASDSSFRSGTRAMTECPETDVDNTAPPAARTFRRNAGAGSTRMSTSARPCASILTPVG